MITFVRNGFLLTPAPPAGNNAVGIYTVKQIALPMLAEQSAGSIEIFL